MQELVAGVERLRFDLEADVEQQRGAQLLPFSGMSSTQCPFRHAGVERAVVCKHWLRGLCKKGDGCGFLHAYDVTKMPECYFHSKFGECSNKDCPFLHVDAAADNGACPWYDRGFCRHGPLCKYKHRRRVMCANYLVGFCPEGPKCRFTHLKAGLTIRSADPAKVTQGGSRADPPRAEALSSVSLLQCSCRSQGTAVSDCLVSPQGAECPRELAWRAPAAGRESSPEDAPPAEPPLLAAAQPGATSSVPPSLQWLLEPGTCFKCGQKGHYAGKCRKNELEILLGK
ncbi:putative cleavage and polyadenylation specificity factor subunit 4-like protein isoform X1 [Anser cygnoides]|uniref:putative cleavage and polyadenylation specificity factor subunit 4-like protein isoform X1 n=1 Tax=Anser cygnoides TaxID=8845 RepID=UPI0034D1EF84